jgi:hypothetical protein
VAGCLHEPSICTLPLPGWDPLSAQHVIRYQDGDEAPLWAGAERIRLAFTAGENLEAPSADQLERLAASYSRWAVAVSAWRAQGGRGGAAAGDAGAGPPLAEAPLGSDAWVSVWGWGHARARLQLGGGAPLRGGVAPAVLDASPASGRRWPCFCFSGRRRCRPFTRNPAPALPLPSQAAHGFGYASDDRDVPALLRAKAMALLGHAALLRSGHSRSVWRPAPAGGDSGARGRKRARPHKTAAAASSGGAAATNEAAPAKGPAAAGAVADAEGGDVEGGDAAGGTGAAAAQQSGSACSSQDRQQGPAPDGGAEAGPAAAAETAAGCGGDAAMDEAGTPGGRVGREATGPTVLRPRQENGTTPEPGPSKSPLAAAPACLDAPQAPAVAGMLQEKQDECQQRQEQHQEQQQQQQQQQQRWRQEPEARAAEQPPAAGRGAGAPEGGGALAPSASVSSVGAPAEWEVSLVPGEVVWVQTKTDPVWPALVITAEEADDFRRPRQAGGAAGAGSARTRGR